MQIDYTAYEQAFRTQGQRNEAYIAQFTASLKASGLAAEQIKREVRDVGRFLNGYLLHEDDPSAEMGCYLVDDYMENYVIQHSPWATPEAIERSGNSLVSFYSWMLEAHQVDEDAFEELQATIDAQLPLWQEACAQANASTASTSSQSLLGAIQDTVTRSVASEPVGADDSIDMLLLSLLYLGETEGGTSDPLGAALARLRERGLVAGGALAAPTLTARGRAEATDALATLGLAHLSHGHASNASGASSVSGVSNVSNS